MIIKKIISGAQTGADRAALDFAINNDIPHGGWVPKGRKAEDGVIPERYRVTEAAEAEYSRRTALNVMDADGTLIFSHGPLTGGSALTEKLALKYHKPCLHIDFHQKPEFQATVDIMHWLETHRVRVLNIAGPRSSNDEKIYEAVTRMLEAVWYLVMIGDNMPDMVHQLYGSRGEAPSVNGPADTGRALPASVADAVSCLIEALPLKDKTRMAQMTETDLNYLHPSLGMYIQNNFKLGNDNENLMASCRKHSEDMGLDVDGAVRVIIRALWQKLNKTHRLRRVK
jgi:hypothetical protein